MVIELIEGRVPSQLVGSGGYAAAVGYGRDAEEARSHGGWPAVPGKEESFRIVAVHDDPDESDPGNRRIGLDVCLFHTTDDDQDTPDTVRAHLASLLDNRLYAQAIDYCFT